MMINFIIFSLLFVMFIFFLVVNSRNMSLLANVKTLKGMHDDNVTLIGLMASGVEVDMEELESEMKRIRPLLLEINKQLDNVNRLEGCVVVDESYIPKDMVENFKRNDVRRK